MLCRKLTFVFVLLVASAFCEESDDYNDEDYNEYPESADEDAIADMADQVVALIKKNNVTCDNYDSYCMNRAYESAKLTNPKYSSLDDLKPSKTACEDLFRPIVCPNSASAAKSTA